MNTSGKFKVLPFSAATTSNSIRQYTLVGQPVTWFLSTESYALLLLLLSSILYSVMATYIQLAVAASGIPSTELVLLRATFQGLLVVTGMVIWRDDQGKRLIWVPLCRPPLRAIVVARGMAGGLGFLLYYYTMSVLPLGDATTLLSLNPVLTILAGGLFLHEAIHMSHVVAAVGSVVGCVLMAQPSFLFGHVSTHEWSWGYLTGPLGACCAATVYVLIRRAGKDGAHTLQLLFSWVLFGIIFSILIGVALPLAMGQKVAFVWPTSPRIWAYILAVCVFGSGSHFLMNYAARLAPAGLSSIVRASGIVWSYSLEWIVFKEWPTSIVTAGVVLIVGSLATIALEKYQESLPVQISDEPERAPLISTPPRIEAQTSYGIPDTKHVTLGSGA